MYKKMFIVGAMLIAMLQLSAQDNQTVYQFKLNNINSEKVDLKQYKGKVLLIVNTASKCGLTPQYEGLEALYQQYKSKGLVVLGFPCNQFLGQEPGTAEEIQNFCTNKYNVTFPLFEKLEVNGDNTSPLYQFLKKQMPLETSKNDIRWNFEKFLVDKNGKVVKRFSPKTKPADLTSDIEVLLR